MKDTRTFGWIAGALVAVAAGIVFASTTADTSSTQCPHDKGATCASHSSGCGQSSGCYGASSSGCPR